MAQTKTARPNRPDRNGQTKKSCSAVSRPGIIFTCIWHQSYENHIYRFRSKPYHMIIYGIVSSVCSFVPCGSGPVFFIADSFLVILEPILLTMLQAEQEFSNQRKVSFQKLCSFSQTWSKIQQLISINIWFSLSSASKLNHYRHFPIKYKHFKLTITIQN